MVGGCMQKVKYKDTYIYIDDSPLAEEKTGVVIKDSELEKTQEIKPIDEEALLQDTNIDIFGDDTNDKS